MKEKIHIKEKFEKKKRANFSLFIKKKFPFTKKIPTSNECEDPLNLSISLSGGKEINRDSLSSGERTGKTQSP